MSSELSSTLISLELLDSGRPKHKGERDGGGGGDGQVGGCPALFIFCIKYSVWHEGAPHPTPTPHACSCAELNPRICVGPSRRQSDSV